MNYSPQESIAQCWVDISEDPIVFNQQVRGGFWGRIRDIYEQVKPTTIVFIFGKASSGYLARLNLSPDEEVMIVLRKSAVKVCEGKPFAN